MLRVKSLQGVYPNPPFGLILDSTAICGPIPSRHLEPAEPRPQFLDGLGALLAPKIEVSRRQY